MNKESVDVLIIGAGPSGAVAASYLHQNHVNVKIVEKSNFPRFTIGESLIPRCMDHFDEAGLLDCIKKQNFEIKEGARFYRGEEMCMFDFSKKFSEGWNWTWQVPRADFDKTLTDELIKRGVAIDFETEVTNVVFNEHLVTTTVKDKENNTKDINAKFILDASGFGRVLPTILGLNAPSSIPKNSSIFTHVKDINRPKGKTGSLITFEIIQQDVWLWVIPFANGNTSIGFVGPTAYIESLGTNTEHALRTLLKQSKYYQDQFNNIDFLFPPKCIKNLAKSVTKTYGNRFALTGNSAEFLDPVFSSGVSFATESGLLAAKLALKELNNEIVNWEVEYAQHIKQGVDVFSTYVKEWYNGNLQKLFFHQPENPDVKEKICAVLAGYVWDKSNPFVKKHHRVIRSMAHVLDLEA